ncbi:hypothetical protein AMJ87_10920 [candidate division WOR_3 bacterium SM23_60]|uniref:Uncharacterized protein n=1 Tax=candidate division WOR_3 bacterium SM23_60 TaxID=1703780 RepID=A0A0S8GAN0_UNCW3|nr:MAG: hypothetical protein AMJ87_10920 [candidate division WOR_3 bacterium SM23_60]
MSYKKARGKATLELKVGLNFYDLVKALKQLDPKVRQDFIEDLQAATSPSYIQSIREARAEYRSGKTVSHNKVFKRQLRKKKRRTKNI